MGNSARHLPQTCSSPSVSLPEPDPNPASEERAKIKKLFLLPFEIVVPGKNLNSILSIKRLLLKLIEETNIHFVGNNREVNELANKHLANSLPT